MRRQTIDGPEGGLDRSVLSEVEVNYLDLFSGIGGFTLGLQQAGFKFDWLGHSEIDKYANQIYEKHYPKSEALGNVKTINPDRLPRLNFITFGFPCQDLSIAGKRGGLRAKRSSLFFEAMRIIRDTKPDYFILENVKGLFSSNGGQDWLVVLKEIADSGYDGQWQLLNTRWFLPQNRERIYFVGHIRGECRPKVFPIGETNKVGRTGTWAYAIDSNIGKGCRGHRRRTMIQIVQRPHGFNKGGAKELPSLRGSAMEQNDFIANAVDCDGYLRRGARPRDENGKPQLLPIGYRRIRRLTPIECERLQGFPDNWTEGISDTQRYKCLGNACSVPVVKAIGERLNGINPTK